MMVSANTSEQHAKVLRRDDHIQGMEEYHRTSNPLGMQLKTRCEGVCSDVVYCDQKCVCQINRS
jgi:hypothetical protein